MEPYKYVCKYLDALHSGNWEKAEEYLSCAKKLISITIPTLDTIAPNVRLYTNVCSYLDALHSGKLELAEKHLACAQNAYDILFGIIVIPEVVPIPILPPSIEPVCEIPLRRLSDFVAPYSYCGTAYLGTSTSTPTWTIYRIQVANNGSITIQSAVNVAWDNRLTAIYT
jgi:hypothetical protein